MTLPRRTGRRGRLLEALAVLLLAGFLCALAPLQSNPWPPPATSRAALAWAAGLLLLYALLSLCWLRRGREPQPAMQADGWWVLHASQTGSADALAQRTAQALRANGVEAQARPLAAHQWERDQRVLLIASTTGEGEPPDSTVAPWRAWQAMELDLSGVRYALLALGDHHYTQFCAFGRSLDGWLGRQHATPLFPRIEADNLAPDALEHWFADVGTACCQRPLAAPPADPLTRWRLTGRRHLNPGSQGGAVHLLRLAPEQGALPPWVAGDLVDVAPPANPDGDDAPRRYSIASLPTDGAIELLVRETRRDDGAPGRVSHALCQTLNPGESVMLRLHPNPAFHPPATSGGPDILIGNGTGLAGLRAHIKTAEATQRHGLWLLFGERTQGVDDLLQDETNAWQASGVLARVDRVYSRSGEPSGYVQALLQQHGADVQKHLARGATIYVCGSQHGMGAGVEAALIAVLGRSALEALRAQGRYRRDVY